MVVRDDDLRSLQVAEHVGGHQLAAGVVGVRVVRAQDPESVPDRHARRDHEEPASVPLAAGAADGVDRLPGDDQRHHRGLAGARGELQGQPGEPGVGLLAGLLEFVEDLSVLSPELRGDLGQPDSRLYRFDLAEEGPDVAEVVAAPVPEEPRRLGRHSPRGRIGQLPPAVHAKADAADERGPVVLLIVGFERLRSLVVTILRCSSFCFFGLGIGETNATWRRPSATLFVGWPVSSSSQWREGYSVGRVQDRLLEELLAHPLVGRFYASVRGTNGSTMVSPSMRRRSCRSSL